VGFNIDGIARQRSKVDLSAKQVGTFSFVGEFGADALEIARRIAAIKLRLDPVIALHDLQCRFGRSNRGG
jgi:hypothetical protein